MWNVMQTSASQCVSFPWLGLLLDSLGQCAGLLEWITYILVSARIFRRTKWEEGLTALAFSKERDKTQSRQSGPVCIFNCAGILTLRFFSVSSQNCSCFLLFCLVGVQISSWTEGLRGVLPNVLGSTLMRNLLECSWRQLWADEPDIWRSVAPNSRLARNRCSETPENNRN